MKQFIAVGNFEQQTSHCPTYIAGLVLDEARDYFRTEIPDDYATELARSAELVFAKHLFWRRKFQDADGREYLLSSMRHWLASVLAKEKPALVRDLPESFKIGYPLPLQPILRAKMTHKKPGASRSVSRFTHGCELLAL